MTEGDRKSLVPDIKTRIRAGGAHTQSQSPSVTRPKSRPSWLADGPTTERVRVRSCPRCHKTVIEALVDGIRPARADLITLTPRQELAVRTTGGETFRLGPDPIVDRHGVLIASVQQCLWSRHLEHIRARPGQGVPLHICGVRWGPPDGSLLHLRRNTRLPPNSPPPF